MDILKRQGVRAAAFIAGFVLWQGAAQAAVAQAGELFVLEQEPKGKTPEINRVFRAGLELWFCRVRGELESDRDGVTDTKFSISGEGGIESGVLPKFFVDFSPNADFLFRFSLRSLNESGSETLTKHVVFDREDFPIGTRVSSDLEALWIGLEMRLPARVEQAELFQGQAVIGLDVFNAEFEMSGAPGKGRQRYAIECLDMGVDVKVRIAEGGYFGGNAGVIWGFADAFIGGELALKAGYLSPRVAVDAGFRWWAIGGAINDEPDLDLRLRGLFVGATVRF